MTDSHNETQVPPVSRGRKLWWLLPLGVLVLLMGMIYMLVHMSSADPEMYPTTQLCLFVAEHAG